VLLIVTPAAVNIATGRAANYPFGCWRCQPSGVDVPNASP
jgi:hypothetical protein